MTNSSLRKLWLDPTFIRVAPFLIFVGLTACQGLLGPSSRFWVYLIKTLAGAAMLWAIYPMVAEVRWKLSWEAVAAGVAIFAVWVGLDGLYPPLLDFVKKLLCPAVEPMGFAKWCATTSPPPVPWNPHEHFGSSTAWGFALARLAGSTLVVPPLEEMFYRSFLYRYIVTPDFQKVPLDYLRWKPFLITSIVFGLVHYEWLPGIICGLVYQALVIHKDRLGDAMTAHAITNFLLGLWVMSKGAWHFW